ncbi:MAG: sigma-70 family RNA polymerase sigma factor [Elusimicrobiota bacterium]
MEYKSLNDEELIKLAKNEDARALATLIDRYQKPLFNFILQMVNCRDTAEDILQDSFLKAITALPKFRYKNFKNYLYKIANNTVIDRYRKKKREGIIEIPLQFSVNNCGEEKNIEIKDIKALSPEDEFYKSELSRQLNNAIQQLPHEQKQVFLLHEYSQLTFEEIAKTTNCSISTVLSRFRYAIEKLREKLKEEYDEEN